MHNCASSPLHWIESVPNPSTSNSKHWTSRLCHTIRLSCPPKKNHVHLDFTLPTDDNLRRFRSWHSSEIQNKVSAQIYWTRSQATAYRLCLPKSLELYGIDVLPHKLTQQNDLQTFYSSECPSKRQALPSHTQPYKRGENVKPSTSREEISQTNKKVSDLSFLDIQQYDLVTASAT